MKLSFVATLTMAFGQLLLVPAQRLRASSSTRSVTEESASSTPRVWLTLDDYDLEGWMPQDLGGTKIALSDVHVDEELSEDELGFLVANVLESLDVAADSILQGQEVGQGRMDAGIDARSLEEEEMLRDDADQQGSRSLWFWQRKRPSVIADASDVVAPSIFEGIKKVTDSPTQAPTVTPTVAPTMAPTRAPVAAPSQVPTNRPTWRDDSFLSKYGPYGDSMNDHYSGASQFGNHHCQFCKNDDDYYNDYYGRNLQVFSDEDGWMHPQALESFANGMLCEALREGPFPVFHSVEICKVTLPTSNTRSSDESVGGVEV